MKRRISLSESLVVNMESILNLLLGRKGNSAEVAKARLSVIVASSNTDSELVRELEERLKKVVHEFYLEKNLSDEEIENLHYNLNDETGVMEVSIPIQAK
jgi:septum formation topological specificity factor MinE